MFGASTSKAKRSKSFNQKKNEELPLPESSHLSRRITISPSSHNNHHRHQRQRHDYHYQQQQQQQQQPQRQLLLQSPNLFITKPRSTLQFRRLVFKHSNSLEKRKSVSLDDVGFFDRLACISNSATSPETPVAQQKGMLQVGMSAERSLSDFEIQKERRAGSEFERVMGELRSRQRQRPRRASQEYGIAERVNEEKTQNSMKQIQPFPVDVELRHQPDEVGRRPAYRSQTMQPYSFINFDEQPEIFRDIDIRGVTKIICDGNVTKVSKNQALRITNYQMCIRSDKGVEDVIVDYLNQISYKQVSKKEIVISSTGRDACKLYKLQFDNTKDMNIALLDLGRCGMLNSEEKSQIKHKLLKLLGKRSSKDLLEKKGIIKNEPIFGNTLKHLYEACKQPVPEFVTRIIQFIEMSKNIKSVGLYRASGNLATIQKIRFHIDKNNLKILDEFKNDIDVLTGSLKLFFRELKEPLIPHKTYEDLCKYIDRELNIKTIESVKQLINKLDTPHRKTFLTLLEHLLRVESHSDENRMDAYNISIVWGPTLIWPPDNCQENILLSHTNANKVIELLLNVYKKTTATNNDTLQQKNESSPKISFNKKETEGDAKDVKLNINALILELNENLTTNSLRRTGSRDNLMKSTDSLTKLKDDVPRTPDKDVKYDLELLCSNTKEKIPEFVMKVVPLIERGINIEHIYKKNGCNERLEKIKKKIAKNKSNLNSMDKYNVHDLTWALKNFFLDLRTPLIPKDVFDRLVLASEERIEVTKLRNVKRELNNSNIPCRETLDYLFKHLVKVSKHEESNKMSKHNIATEWAPFLCYRFVENNEISVGCCIHVIDTLLQIYDTRTRTNTDSLERDTNRFDIQENPLGRSPDRLENSNSTSPSQGTYLQSLEKNVNLGLPPVFKRKQKLAKNDSSLYRASKLITKPPSFYDNVHGSYAEEAKNEATILEMGTSKSAKKSLEDRTKL